MNQVRIYHPRLDRYVNVPESAVPIHRESGWILADELPGETSALPAAEPAATPAPEQAATQPRSRGQSKEK